MIHIPFMENVRIKSMLLKVGAWYLLSFSSTVMSLPVFEGRGDIAPRHVKLYSNHPNIVDFSDAENLQPHLDLALLEGEIGVVEYPLRVAAFTSVHSLSLLFVSFSLSSGHRRPTDQR